MSEKFKGVWILSVPTVYIYAFSRRFYPKRLTVHSGYTLLLFFVSMCVPWELNPQPFVLLTQCSTTELQEHSFLWQCFDLISLVFSSQESSLCICQVCVSPEAKD